MTTAITCRHPDPEYPCTLAPLLVIPGCAVRYLDTARYDLNAGDTASADLLSVQGPFAWWLNGIDIAFTGAAR